jgi:uncharacterized protein (TIGR00251 family)
MNEQPPCHIDGDDVILQVQVSARSTRQEIEIRDGTIRLRIKSAPVDGKANKAIQKLLSQSFSVPMGSIRIERGVSARRKTIRIVAPGTHPDWLIELLRR